MRCKKICLYSAYALNILLITVVITFGLLQFLVIKSSLTFQRSQYDVMDHARLEHHVIHDETTCMPPLEDGDPTDSFYQIGKLRIFLQRPFYDERFNQRIFRFFGMHDKNILDEPLWCTFLANLESDKENLTRQTVRMRRYIIFPEWPNMDSKSHAYSYECNVTGYHVNMDPIEIYPYGQKYAVKIPIQIVRTRKAEDFALCLKGTFGLLNPIRLVEWIEFNRYLGVEKFIIYDMAIQGVARRVLKYYQLAGLVEVVPYRFPLVMQMLSREFWGENNIPEKEILEQSYLVGLNDCVYRYRHVHKFILVIDLDEVVTPTNITDSLFKMAVRAAEEYPNMQAVSFKSMIHAQEYGFNWTGTKSKLFMQNYLLRTELTRIQPKSLFYSKNILAVNWHAPVQKHIDGLEFYIMLNQTRYGALHHFRKISSWKNMETYQKPKAKDANIARYRSIMEERVSSILNKILEPG